MKPSEELEASDPQASKPNQKEKAPIAGAFFMGDWLPLDLVSPVRCRHLAFGNVACVSGLEGFIALGTIGRTLDSLLTKADCLDLATDLSHHNVALGWVVRRSARLVVTGDAGSCEARIFFHGLPFLRRNHGCGDDRSD